MPMVIACHLVLERESDSFPEQDLFDWLGTQADFSRLLTLQASHPFLVSVLVFFCRKRGGDRKNGLAPKNNFADYQGLTKADCSKSCFTNYPVRINYILEEQTCLCYEKSH
jgi:hypothetical protein